MTQVPIGNNINIAATNLIAGKLVGIPTETVYGLAGNATKAETVAQIFLAKQRPRFNPLILHVAAIETIEEYAELNSTALQLIQAFMPGPLTLLLPKKNSVPDIVTAGSNKVAIRIPNHPLTLQLLQQLAFPLAAPSANKFGYVSPTTAMHVANGFTTNELSYVLNGGTTNIGIESTIVEPTNNKIIIHRLGGTAIESIATTTNLPIEFQTKATNTPQTAGQIKSHYATHTPLYKGNVEDLLQQFTNKKIAIISLQKTYSHTQNSIANFALTKDGNTNTAAALLFATMRTIDYENFDIILAEDFPTQGLGAAINDRLNRAQFIFKQ
jgi:L-threonylcarbamoyladenylate synthase